jgi:hypothetical protein
MRSNHTPGLDLAGRFAAAEAMSARREFIEPEHLFIGLCKLEALAGPARPRDTGRPDDAASTQGEIEAFNTLLAHFKDGSDCVASGAAHAHTDRRD